MDEDHKLFYKIEYKDVLERFGEEKIISRYEFIFKFCQDFIEAHKYKDSLLLCKYIIDHIVVDYFVDIFRIKPFQEIELVNEPKIYAYLSYWILRHKPIQIKDDSNSEELVFINEELVSALLQSFLFDNPKVVRHQKSEETVINEFSDLLLYFFKYRNYTAQSIEFMIMAYKAGMAYQRTIDFMK